MSTASRESPPLIELARVSFSYPRADGRDDVRPSVPQAGHGDDRCDAPGSERPLIDDLSLSVGRGEAVALLGPNGCGKSTVLRLACGLSHPDSGEVRYDGEVVDATSMADRAFAKRLHRRQGLVFQDPDTQLFCPSVADEVAFGPRQMGLPEGEVALRVDDTLALLGIPHLRHRVPYRLSGGEKRRVALAAVVSMSPESLVLDEPTDALDPEARDVVADFLRAYLGRGGTVLLATHELALARDLGAREVGLGGRRGSGE